MAESDIMLQDKVRGMSANYLRSGYALQVVLPATPGNRLQVLFRTSRESSRGEGGKAVTGGLGVEASRDSYDMLPNWDVRDAISIRPASADCSREEGSQFSPRSVQVGGAEDMTTLQLLVAHDSILLGTDQLENVLPGLYQLCMHYMGRTRADTPPFYAVPSSSATGVSIRLQRAATALTVNSLQPAMGLRAAVPRCQGNLITLSLLIPPTNSEMLDFSWSLPSLSKSLPLAGAEERTGTVWIWFVPPETHCNSSLKNLSKETSAVMPASYGFTNPLGEDNVDPLSPRTKWTHAYLNGSFLDESLKMLQVIQ